jgi:pyruvate dehydrogenase E2 component (dihydrolipoamide acetyltransferase)
MDFPGSTTEIPVKGVRKVVAGRMLNSLQTTAQLTLNTSADARSILGYRAKCKDAPEDAGVGGIGINDMVLYATIKTLGEFPEFNAHYLGSKIVEFDNVHLGFAVDTPRGLMVPVIRYANLMSLKQLSVETKRLAKACIEGTIDPDALSGGTFTVTNLGAMGIESFTPVLNAPEVGILGVCSIQPKPVMKGSDVEFVPHMGLSLTFDHCAVDGAPGARFLAVMRQKLADFAFELTLAG